MKKDIEVLSNENSHLTKSLSYIEKERDDLDLQKKEIQSQFEDCEKKLTQVTCLCKITSLQLLSESKDPY